MDKIYQVEFHYNQWEATTVMLTSSYEKAIKETFSQARSCNKNQQYSERVVLKHYHDGHSTYHKKLQFDETGLVK